jgi:hypothetical protein
MRSLAAKGMSAGSSALSSKVIRSCHRHSSNTSGVVSTAQKIIKVDIILCRRRSGKRTHEGQWIISPAQSALVEIKYTTDTDPNRTHRDTEQDT